MEATCGHAHLVDHTQGQKLCGAARHLCSAVRARARRVDRNIVFQDVYGIFRLLPSLGLDGALDHDVGDAVADGGCSIGVALFHACGQFNVRLLVAIRVLILRACERLRNDEFG
eukprot:scaffold34447_cov36-Tisochrysis_lutea.AAC.7